VPANPHKYRISEIDKTLSIIDRLFCSKFADFRAVNDATAQLSAEMPKIKQLWRQIKTNLEKTSTDLSKL